MNVLDFYGTQSPITEPDAYAKRLEDLPRDIPGLCRAARGLVFAIDAEELYGYRIPQDRRREVDTRYVEKILGRIIQLDDRPLSLPRTLEKRFVGCDRDRAVLICAVLRHRGIPARIRDGFAPYISGFGPGFTVRHVALEYWNSDEARWCLADPGQDDLLIARNRISFDPTDIPRDRFLVAGRVWEMCRRGEARWDDFGEYPDPPLKGAWFIRNTLVRDCAFLNRIEVLLWDSWGSLMVPDPEPSERELALLDELAALTQQGHEAFEKLRTLYEKEPELKVPPVVTCYSPVAEPTEVRLAI